MNSFSRGSRFRDLDFNLDRGIKGYHAIARNTDLGIPTFNGVNP